MKKTVKIEELPQRVDEIVTELTDTGEPVFIMREGEETGVLVSPAVWEKILKEICGFTPQVTAEK